MLTRVLIVTMVWVLVGAPAVGLSVGHQRATGGDLLADLAAGCATGADPAVSDGDPNLPFAVPAGIVARPLAAASAQRLPEGTEFLLTAGRLTIAPTAESKRRRADGPILIVVERGPVAVSVHGRAQEYESGASLLVEPNSLYALRNPTLVPASVLLVGVVPPEGRAPIGAYGGFSIWEPDPGEEELIARERFFGAAVVGLARVETVLFVACLTWTDPAAELASGGVPGPVGLLVLAGGSRLNATEPLAAGDCWLIPAFAPVRLEAAAPASTVLLFGAVPVAALARPATAVAAAAGPAPTAGSPGCAGPEVDDDGTD